MVIVCYIADNFRARSRDIGTRDCQVPIAPHLRVVFANQSAYKLGKCQCYWRFRYAVSIRAVCYARVYTR